ncbi:MAG: UDP-N-acetylglucosamine 1-carboxyvinyltransferase, partial [Bacteroidales bacterium]|nr:UDP-N-acetylglucosamine 1-carboxyvinyltransferase [Bacteroidales bacterium]
MSSFEITGGKRLSGEIIPQGAKNEALQVICATVLTSDKVVIENIPDIRDVNKLIDILRLIDVKVERLSADTYSFQADNIDLNKLESDEFCDTASKLRGSIMLAGPLLSRFGKATFPQPGGDKIG